MIGGKGDFRLPKIENYGKKHRRHLDLPRLFAVALAHFDLTKHRKYVDDPFYYLECEYASNVLIRIIERGVSARFFIRTMSAVADAGVVEKAERSRTSADEVN